MEPLRLTILSSRDVTPRRVREEVLALIKRLSLTDVAKKGAVLMTQANKVFTGKCFRCGKRGHRKSDCAMKSHINHSNNERDTTSDQKRASRAAVALTTGQNPHGQIALLSQLNLGQYDFIVDNAAACGHTAVHRKKFVDYVKSNTMSPIAAYGKDSNSVEVVGSGSVLIRTEMGEVVLENVKHVPDGGANLLSIRVAIERLGKEASWSETVYGGKLKKGKQVVLNATPQDGFLVIRNSWYPSHANLAVPAGNGIDMRQAHCRYGHISPKLIKIMAAKQIIPVVRG